MPAITHFRGGVSNLGNTAGSTGTGYRQIVFVGSDNVTLSQSTDGQNLTISFSAPSPGAGTISSATTVSSVHSVNVVGADAGRYALEGHQHGGVISMGASNVGSTAGNTTVRHGHFVFAGSNAITLSQETAAAGANTMHVQGPRSATTISAVSAANVIGTRGTAYALEDHQHAGVFSAGASNVGSTAGNTTVVPGRFVFAGSNAVTVSQETAANSLNTLHVQGPRSATTISAVTSANVIGTRGTAFALEDHQHEGVYQVGLSTAGNTAGNTFLRPGRIAFQGSNAITLSGETAANSLQTIHIQGPRSATTVSSVTTGNVAGTVGTAFALEDHQHAGVQRIGVSTGGNTAGNTTLLHGRSVYFSGQANITLSQVTDANHDMTIGISGGAGGGGGFSAGVSTGGNTAGSTGVTGTRLVFVGSPNITLSQSTDANGGTLTISANNPSGGSFSAGVSNLGNTAGSTGVSGTRVVFVGTDGLTLSQSTDANGATITIDPPMTTMHSWVRGYPLATGSANAPMSQNVSAWTNAAIFQPMRMDGQPFGSFMTIETLMHWMSISGSTTTMQSSYSSTFYYGLYTLNGSTLSLLNSASVSFGKGATSSNNSTLYAGPRWLTVHSSAWSVQPTLHPLSSYWLATMWRFGGVSNQTLSQIGQQGLTTARWSGTIGAASAAVEPMPFVGWYNTTTTALPASAERSNFQSMQNNHMIPFMVFLGTAGVSSW